MTQLSLFDPQDNQDAYPLPELIARRWSFPLQIQEVNGVDFYSVQDWVCGVAGVADARNTIAGVKRRSPELCSSWIQLPYKAKNGKTYRVSFADDENLYSITQRLDKSTGAVDAILKFLAKSGKKVDGYRLDHSKAIEDGISSYRNEGKSNEWIAARGQGVVSRKDFTDALQDVIAGIDGAFYAQSTENLYKTLWNRTTAQLRGDLEITKHQNPRDHMGQFALIYIRLAEAIAADRLREHDTVDRALAAEIIYDVTKLIQAQAQATSAALGRDLVTGKPLLTARAQK